MIQIIDEETPHAMRNFDELPDSAFVRMPTVKALYCCSPSTVLRWVKTGEIPAPHKIFGNITVWNVGELRRALAAVLNKD